MGPSTVATKPLRGYRTFHHKVRTGCLTCKRRRLKCDEAKPECTKCRTSSRVCEGYEPPKPWIFELPTKGPSSSELEQHLFSFAHREGVKYITLYVKSSTCFFTTYAPQIAYAQPAAKHALLALSAQYKAIINHINPQEFGEKASKYRTDALIHYNRAMKTLAQTDQRQTPLEVLLTCSLLFTAIELWPQKNMAPHIHILHGTRICQAVLSTTIYSNTLMGYLLRLLLTLSENVASYNDDFTEKSLNITDAYMDGLWPIPAIFHEPADAEEQVDKLVKRVARLDKMSAGEHPSRRKRLWEIHSWLSVGIYDSKQLVSKRTATYHDFRLLQLHLRVVSVMLKTNMVSDEMVFDSCREDFEHILAEIEELLAYELLPGSERGPASVRSNLGLIPPMFLVATKCRDSTLRRRALELLHGSRRRERSWNSCTAAMLAQTVIEVEGSPVGDVPNAKQRVCLSQIAFDRVKGQITIQYRREPWDASGFEHTAVKPWRPKIDDNYEIVQLSRKSLRAYGYTGTILVSPRITCQCVDEERV